MSATIYEFPARGRYAVGGQNEPATVPANAFVSPAFALARTLKTKTVMGNGWYHEAAIEAELSPKN